MASIGRITPLRGPPKERPESVPKLRGAQAFPPSTTGPPQSSFPPSAWSLRSGTVLTDRVRTLAANLEGLPGTFHLPNSELRAFQEWRYVPPNPDYSNKATRWIPERPYFSCRSKRDTPLLQRAGRGSIGQAVRRDWRDAGGRLFQVRAEGLREDFPPLRTLNLTPGNLPARTTSFLGRENHLAEVGRLLREARFVTLSGVGGVGKTRLAMQLAAEVSTNYPDGAWLVELASLRDAMAVGHAVAGVFGVREQPGKTIQQSVVAWLGARRLLLVLDNCEHLIDAAADLVRDILTRCPNVTVLATSREALMLDGERSWPVPPNSMASRWRSNWRRRGCAP